MECPPSILKINFHIHYPTNYLHLKKQEILLFPLLSYTRAKSRKYVIFATSNGYSSNTKERESRVHMAN